MGRQNRKVGKKWQELLGLTAIPYFGQDTLTYQDDSQNEFVFNPETMSLINPIDIENGLYNKNAYDEGYYTPLYDNDVFLGYAYTNNDFAYLDAFLNEQNYHVSSGNVKINQEKQQVTSQSVSSFISDEFTEAENYELSFTYEVSGKYIYRNVILYGFDSTIQNGYKFGIDIPSKTGLCVEKFIDGEMDTRTKYADNCFDAGVYKIKIIRNGSKASFFVNDTKMGTINDVERNTLGLWKWGGGSSNIRDIFIKEVGKTNISVTITDGTNAIESASVTLTDVIDETEITGTTGSAGGCTLSNVPLGRYTVTVTATDFTDYTETINVTSDTTTLAITMTQPEQQQEEEPQTP